MKDKTYDMASFYRYSATSLDLYIHFVLIVK